MVKNAPRYHPEIEIWKAGVVPSNPGENGDGCGEGTREGRLCGRAPVLKDQRCIFHSQAPKDRYQFQAEFVKYVKEAKAGEVLDFTQMHFPKFSLPNGFRFEADADFSRSIFTDEVDFSDVIFGARAFFSGVTFKKQAAFAKATFKNEAVFTEAIFEDYAWFFWAVFENVAVFVRTQFKNHAGFAYTQFSSPEDGPRFMSASFEKDANFKSVALAGPSGFNSCRFDGLTNFSNSAFEHVVSFELTTFRGPAFFRDCSIYRLVSFQHADFSHEATFEDLRFPDPKLGGVAVGVDFSRVRVAGKDAVRFIGLSVPLDMARIRLAFTDAAALRFVNVQWQPWNRRKWSAFDRVLDRDHADAVRVADERYLNRVAEPPEHIREGNYSQELAMATEAASREAVSPAVVATIYKGLRESYQRSLRYSEAGLFYIREMEMRRESLAGSKQMGATPYERRSKQLLRAYGVLSLYGESYSRVLVLSIIVILSFGVLRWVIYPVLGGPHDDPMLESIQAFLLVRNVDLIDAVERMAGIVLIALLGLALGRNFRR